MGRGFTLIELVIVIGILAILAVAAIIVLNPAQLLAQARDSQRINDLNSVKSAIGLYLATASTPDLTYGFSGTACRYTAGTTCPFTCSGGTCSVSSSTVTNGTGWVLVKLTDTPSGSPLATFPIDPTNNSTYFYGYAGSDTSATFELDAVLESTKYIPIMSSDGGNSTSYYEIGTQPGLNL